MTGILTIAPGSPNWWLSPDIWVTPVGSPTTPPGTANPIAGEAYNVSVRVHDNYPDPVPNGWDLFVCWMIPTTGPFPTPTGGQVLNNAPITVNFRRRVPLLCRRQRPGRPLLRTAATSA